MKNLFIICLLVLFARTTFAQVSKDKQTENIGLIKDKLQPVTSAKVSGYVGDKLDLSYSNRILAQDVPYLIEPFKTRTETQRWQTEFWGKWFTSAVLAYRYRPEPELKAVLDKAVTDLIATQTADGYIGNYAESNRLDKWDIWGRKYCMLGLIAYYDLTKDQKALQAACKEADFLIKELNDKKIMIVTKGDHRGMPASSVLEPICQLYSRTGDKRYLDFAEEIVRQWEAPEGPKLLSKASVPVGSRYPIPEVWYGPLQGHKAYEMMSCYEGLLELYRLTGKEEYRNAVEKTWQSIKDTEINITGGGSAMECWFGGKELQTLPIYQLQENCVTVTWIKLCQQMLRLTGDAKYADAIEQAYYNALLGAMKPDGSAWAYYSPLIGYRVVHGGQCGMNINCCNASGPRGLFTFPLTTVMSRNEGLQINFFASGSYSLLTPTKQPVKLVQETEYPVDGKIRIQFELPKPEQMEIRIRVPEWSKKTILTVNGEKIIETSAGQYAVIQRKWNSGDVINMELDMRGRVITMGKNPESFAIVRGPIVLARDSRLPGPVMEAIITPVADKDGYINLELQKQNQEGINTQYIATFKAESHELRNDQTIAVPLCDFASAGNIFSDENHFRVWFTQLLDPRKLGQK